MTLPMIKRLARWTLLILAVSLPPMIGRLSATAQVVTPPISELDGAERLPGTALLQHDGDLPAAMMDGAHRLLDRLLADSESARAAKWQRNFASPDRYRESVAPQRAEWKRVLGVVDARPAPTLEQFGADLESPVVAESRSLHAIQVRWQALDHVWAEGLLLMPTDTPPKACVVALPDASQLPEQIAGLTAEPSLAWAQRIAEAGVLVLIPTLVDRNHQFSGNPFVVAHHPMAQMQDSQTHREWLYRQAYHMGRHVLGYEVQKVLAAVDWIEAHHAAALPIGVAGFGEGGLLALYSAACDERIDATLVSGYFDNRQRVCEEPIDRSVFKLLGLFGDAEIASLVAPRALIVEHAEAPRVVDQKGQTITPEFSRLEAEARRAASLTGPLRWAPLVVSDKGRPVEHACQEGLSAFAAQLGAPLRPETTCEHWTSKRLQADPIARQQRTVRQIEAHVQTLVRQSELARDKRFLGQVMPERLNSSRGGAWFKTELVATESPQAFAKATASFREELWAGVLGRIDERVLPPNARTRAIYDHPRWTAYDVVLDVFPESFCWGILVVPKQIPEGERRPVVVCQHGLESVPKDVVLPGQWVGVSDYAAKLAERGFVTFAPHNLYRLGDRFRILNRKANVLGLSFFSLTIAHHRQMLHWMKTLPFVDPQRIAFYGISYGGTTAMFVPSVLEDYCLSICTANLNNWTQKVAGTEDHGYMYSPGEWEMPCFNLGGTFSHAEMAYLIAPRPFFVERGHHDAVARDSQVAAEYAKIAWLYAQLGISDRIGIEYFQGGHCIHGEETFRFLHQQLRHPF